MRSDPFSVFQPGSVVSIAGAGGKTSLMFLLAERLPVLCVVTTTTKVGALQIRRAEQSMTLAQYLEETADALPAKVTWVSPSLEPENGKIRGLALEEFSILTQTCRERGAVLINEADGAAMKHLKAPGAHEPVIPEETSVMICVCGMDTLGKALNGETVHRPEIFSQLTGLTSGEEIRPEHLHRFLLHPDGGFKNCPKKAFRLVVLNQCDHEEQITTARSLAAELIKNQIIDGVWATSFEPRFNLIAHWERL